MTYIYRVICDACGATSTESESIELPRGWAALKSDEPDTDHVYCSACVEKMADALAEKERKAK